MAYTQEPDKVIITSRVVRDRDRDRLKSLGQWAARLKNQMLPQADIEIVRATTVYAPRNARGAMKPMCMDETFYEVLFTLSAGQAARLASSLVDDIVRASAYIPEGVETADLDDIFGPRDPEPVREAESLPEVPVENPSEQVAVQDLTDLDR